MAKIEIKNMTFTYDGQDSLFENVRIDLDTNWRLGLVGRNGRGKTTLLKLLQRQLPYTGEIHTPEAMHYFPSTVQNEQQTVAELINEQVWISVAWQVERELSLLHLEPEQILNQPFNQLSGGEKTKVLLALTFQNQQTFALLDEPTNHLDQVTRQQVEAYLKMKTGFIVVSHDRHLLNAVTDHTLSIERTQLKLYQGNFALYEHEKQLRDADELAQQQQLKRDIKRLSKAASQKAEWSRQREGTINGKASQKGSKSHGDKGFESARAARLMKKAKNIEKRQQAEINEKQQLLRDVEMTDQLTMQPLATSHHPIVRVVQGSLSFKATPLFNPLNFTVDQGDLVALTGNNGIGKSSLLQAIRGGFQGTIFGEIQCAKVKISTVRQDTDHLYGSLSTFCQKQQLNENDLLSMLHKLGLEREAFKTPLELMSRGQQKRVELAKALVTPAELFLFDEPLNYLDVFNQEQLEAVILAVQPTMILVEHDQTFLENIHAKQIHLHS